MIQLWFVVTILQLTASKNGKEGELFPQHRAVGLDTETMCGQFSFLPNKEITSAMVICTCLAYLTKLCHHSHVYLSKTEDKIYVNGEVHKWDTYKLAT